MIRIVDSEVLPPELTCIFQSLEYEEIGYLAFRSIAQVDNVVNFDFALYLNDYEKQEVQNWRMKVLNYQGSNIDIDNLGNYFYFYSDHFLLKEFNNIQTELYFKRPAKNPEHLLADIYALHYTKFRNLFQLGKYMRGGGLLEIGKSESGLFAKGPKYILNYYFEILKLNGSEPYFYGENDPIIWDGEKWISSNAEYKLVLLGKTYFIGHDFQFQCLDENKKAL